MNGEQVKGVLISFGKACAAFGKALVESADGRDGDGQQTGPTEQQIYDAAHNPNNPPPAP